LPPHIIIKRFYISSYQDLLTCACDIYIWTQILAIK